MSYRAFFQQLTGYDPSPFQERVAEAVLAEKNVILQAPTGSGKTWAVVAPFLYSLVNGPRIADRLLYALPLRSLATSLYDSTLTGVKACDGTKEFEKQVRIQTGESKADPYFEGLATFCTIDQLLSSYLLHPVGLPKRCGNISAGAILGALVCFDEFHLLEPHKSMATAIEMLDFVAGKNALSRFVLMTATLSTKTIDWLAPKLNAEVIRLSPTEVERLPSQQEKVREYRWVDEPLSAAAVATSHNGLRTIVIANTVARAQSLYQELNGEKTRGQLGPNTQVRLLHSRFFPRDRKRIEDELSDWFGPKATKSDVVLISTQVVEAGLDFSCENLHTEVAPMNAVVQRAGRCARRTGEKGTVWCYALMTDDNGKPKYGPYRDLSSIVDETASALKARVGQAARPLSFHEELQLVDQVHTDWELEQLKPLESLSRHREAVRKAMDGDDPAAVRNLVRDAASINVLITDDPDSLNFDRKQWPEMLSVPPASLYALFTGKNNSIRDWVAKSAQEREVFQGGKVSIDWVPLTRPDDLNTAGWLIAVHPDYATYCDKVGLIVGQGGSAPEIRYRDRPKFERNSYEYETYADHIRLVCAAGHKRNGSSQVAARRLAELFGIDAAELSRWLDVVYRLHDVGKLSVGWQDAIWKSQATKPRETPVPRPALAHSDYNPATDTAYPRPPHAAEGAYTVSNFLSMALGEENRDASLAALTAIVRHHGAFTSSLTDFRLIPEASHVIAETLAGATTDLNLIDSPKPLHRERFADYLLQAADPEHSNALPLYLYFVRRLRIADQNSFSEN